MPLSYTFSLTPLPVATSLSALTEIGGILGAGHGGGWGWVFMLALVSRVGNCPEGAHSSPRARLKVCEPSGQSHRPQWPYTGPSMWSDGQSALSHCQLFHSPWRTELDTHRLHHGPAITSTVCVCVCVPWLLPPGSARVNRVICEAHCDARTTVWMQRMLPKVNISLAEGSMRRLFPYSLVLSPFQIIIWLPLAKTAHIPAMNAQVTNEMPAHYFLVLQNADFSSFLQSLTERNKSQAKFWHREITLIWIFFGS